MKAEATKEFRKRSDKLKMMGYEIKLCSSTVGMIGPRLLGPKKRLAPPTVP